MLVNDDVETIGRFWSNGKAGGSVVSYVLKNLALEYKVRGITRDVNSPGAQALKKQGVEVVAADLTNRSTIEAALKGVDSVFSLSTIGSNGMGEFEQGKLIADSAMKQGVKYIIWSSLPNVGRISQGKLRNVKHFDEKAKVEDYIRGLQIKSSFISPAFYFQNFTNILKPVPIDGGFGVFNIVKPNAKFPCIDIEHDFGAFVGAILSSPERLADKKLLASNGLFSFSDISEGLTKASGKSVKYVQIPDETFKTYFPPAIADDFLEMFKFYDEYLFGPNTEEWVKNSLNEVQLESLSAQEYLKRLHIDLS